VVPISHIGKVEQEARQLLESGEAHQRELLDRFRKNVRRQRTLIFLRLMIWLVAVGVLVLVLLYS
jgi:hypothetical protein